MSGEALSRTLVLNALRDVAGGQAVLADAESRELVADAFEAAAHEAERHRFRERVAGAEGHLDEETGDFADAIAGSVLEELADRGTEATLVHEASLSVPVREAAVYAFMTSRDPAALADLSLPAAVRERVDEGATALADGDPEAAADAFERAVDESGAGDGGVATRVLAAFAHHLAGADPAAMHLVEETLHLDTRVWTAKLVGYAADHRYPEKFREGKLGSRVFFRWTTEVPADATVTVSVGPAGGEAEPLTGRDECMPLPRLWPETTVRVEVTGELPDLPTIESYYVATGVVDLEVFEVRSVENVLLSGPETADADERVRFR